MYRSVEATMNYTLATFFLILPSLTFADSVLNKDALKNRQEISLAGVLDTSQIPFQLVINPGLKDEERLEIEDLSAKDSLKFERLRVVIKGKLERAKSQWILHNESIRLAKEREVYDVIITSPAKSSSESH